MKKRLRKKLRLREFREDCFELSFRIEPPHSPAEGDAFWDEFIDMIEARRLSCGGGCGAAGWSIVVQGESRRTVTDSDRQAIIDWLGRRERIVCVEASPLRDAWYGWGE